MKKCRGQESPKDFGFGSLEGVLGTWDGEFKATIFAKFTIHSTMEGNSGRPLSCILVPSGLSSEVGKL